MKFLNSLGYIIFFIIMMIFVNLVFGKKVTYWVGGLILLSMVMTNVDKVDVLLNSFSSPKKDSTTTDNQQDAETKRKEQFKRLGDYPDWGVGLSTLNPHDWGSTGGEKDA